MKRLLHISLILLITAVLSAVLISCGNDNDNPAAETTDNAETTVTDQEETTAIENDETTAEETTVFIPEETTEEIFDPVKFVPTSLGKANVAPEGYAMASSAANTDGFSNINLNDGDAFTGFRTAEADNKDKNRVYYVFVDLTRKYKIDSVNILPLMNYETEFPVSFEILVSDDGKNYTHAADGDSEEVKLGGVEARFVKLVTKELGGKDGNYRLTLGEFEVIAEIDSTGNMILNRDGMWMYRDPDIPQKLEVVRYRTDSSAERGALKFASADPQVASVDDDGVVTPTGYGETDIFVSNGADMTACHVRIIDERETTVRTSLFYHSNFGYPEYIPDCLDYIKACGIDYIEETRTYDRAGNKICMYMLFLCAERNIFYSPCDPDGDANFLKLKDEEIIALVEKYQNRPGFFGLYLQDEPHEEYLEYAHVFRVIQEYNPHVTPHLNLLPPYNFGGVDEYFTEFSAVAGGNGRMEYLSYDHYPFLWGGGFNTQVFDSLNRLRKTGLTYNASTGFYMQVMEITGAYRTTNNAELMYNAGLGVAYGIKNFKWFVGLTPLGSGEAFTTGLIGPDFKPSSMYEGVTAANAAVKNLESVLGGCDAIEVYHSDRGGSDALPSDFVMTPVNRDGAIVTLYQALDGSKQQYVAVVNKSFGVNYEIDFTFKVAKDVKELWLCDGENRYPVDIASDGTIEFSLDPGCFCMFKLPEGYDASRPAQENENLALGCGVFVSSSQAEFWSKGKIAAYHLTDGVNKGGYWLSDRKDKTATVTVDLGAVKKVSDVKIYASDGFKFAWMPSAFTILVSEDGVTYTEVKSYTDISYSDSTTPCDCKFDTVSARYVRIRVDSNKFSGLGEIEIYG